MWGLPFREVWALDTEFIAESGALPVPVCLVARDLMSGRVVRLWQDQLAAAPPFDPADAGVLFVAFAAQAEWGVFAALGWPMPVRVLDLFAEFSVLTNGSVRPLGRGLLAVLSHYGIAAITADEKDAGRGLVMRGGPWSAAERMEILQYCASDVDCLGPLLGAMLPQIRATPRGLGQALLRGRYTVAVARMEHTGIPVDAATLHRLRADWDHIRLELVGRIDRDFGVYEGSTFKAGLFAAWLAGNSIPWPRTPAGRLQLDQDTFKDQARTYPVLEPLRQLRYALGQMRLESVAVGPDSRNRTGLMPFMAKTGRNTPSNSKFLFGPAVWLRGLIQPTRSRSLAYIDWSSQEVVVAAALSGDARLMAAVQSGDPYLQFARSAGLAPREATKATHGAIRAMCKIAVLGTNYGMGFRSLAARTGLHPVEAQDVLRRLARTYPVFTEWAETSTSRAMLTHRLETVFGWPLRVAEGASPTSLRNWPVQAAGAEMLRLACCLATEDGIDVCAPVHDALLVEGPTREIAAVVNATKAAMATAATAVLGDGYAIATDAEVISYPDRYADPRGAAMWSEVMSLLTLRGAGDARDSRYSRGARVIKDAEDRDC